MKKLLSLILAGSMLFSLAACGDSSESKDDDSDKKNSSDIVENNGGVGEENDGFVADKGDSDADFSGTQVGEYITFGSYEQDNDTSNGKEEIEWLVLDKQGDKILVISRYALDCKRYNEELTYVTWEGCTLRGWLNDEFINSAFTSSERARIPTVTVTADENPDYDTDPGNDTQDKVFLLSIAEANEYFDSDAARECKATDYAIAQGAYVYEFDGYEGNCWWWLCSPGLNQSYAANGNSDGSVHELGIYVDSSYAAVRPALWINL